MDEAMMRTQLKNVRSERGLVSDAKAKVKGKQVGWAAIHNSKARGRQ
jgi:hypothetical protein